MYKQCMYSKFHKIFRIKEYLYNKLLDAKYLSGFLYFVLGFLALDLFFRYKITIKIGIDEIFIVFVNFNRSPSVFINDEIKIDFMTKITRWVRVSQTLDRRYQSSGDKIEKNLELTPWNLHLFDQLTISSWILTDSR